MSILMALTGKERTGLRVLAFAISLGSLITAILAARADLALLHLALSSIHVMHLSGGVTSLPSLPAALS